MAELPAHCCPAKQSEERGAEEWKCPLQEIAFHQWVLFVFFGQKLLSGSAILVLDRGLLHVRHRDFSCIGAQQKINCSA